MPAKLIDMTGNTYGHLTVTSLSHIEPRTGGGTTVYWNCQCHCGKTVKATRSNLRRPTTRSCGCTRKFVQVKVWKKVEAMEAVT